MKQTFKSLVAVVALLSTAVSTAVPYIAARSDSVNAARDMVGWEEFIHLCDMESTYGAFSVTPEFKQTFNPNKITNCLFGLGADNCATTNCNTNCSTNCGPTIKIQGSQVANRDATAWLGDYFGLPTDYSSEISFCPRVRTGLIDLSLYLGLDELANGMYFRIHAPIVWSRWSLNFNESIKSKGTTAGQYQAGYFSDVVIPTTGLLSSAAAFFSGNSAATLAGATGVTSATAGKFQALKCSRWSANGCDCSGLSLTRLSDIEAALGWNFYCDEDYAVGLSIRASAPTGNKVNECYLFAPVIGQGGSWKLGGGLDAHAIFWRSDDENSSFGLYLEANVQHIFKACQTRCFDLCIADGAGVNSRYMLAEKLTTNATNLKGNPAAPTGALISANSPTSGYTASTLQFANEFAPVANLTTTKVNVDAAVEGDVALKFAYTHGGFTFDLGYEFWGRSCERFCKGANCNASDISNWALKGDAFVYGFPSVTAPSTTGAPLAATQTLTADITGGNSGINTTGQFNNTSIAPLLTSVGLGTNNGSDLAQYAYTANAGQTAGVPLVAGGNTTNMTRTSIQPRVLAETDINYASTKGISNKLFAHFGYAWNEREDWMPFLGIGGEVEWSGGNCNTNCGTSCNTNNCNTNCNTNCSTSCGSTSLQGSCQTCAFSQWGVWAKLGIAFN